MDETESLVKDYLIYRGYTDIVFEPDGNIPPDFLLNSRVAIEVRRLTKQISIPGIHESLEQVFIRLNRRVDEILGSINCSADDKRWYIKIWFRRPIESWKTLLPKIHVNLRTFSRLETNLPQLLIDERNFKLEVIGQRFDEHKNTFLLGSLIDGDAGGWVHDDIESNLTYCVGEKSRKIDHVRLKYKEWWLILVERVPYSLSDEMRDEIRDKLREKVAFKGPWEKIILISPLDFKKCLEI